MHIFLCRAKTRAPVGAASTRPKHLFVHISRACLFLCSQCNVFYYFVTGIWFSFFLHVCTDVYNHLVTVRWQWDLHA